MNIQEQHRGHPKQRIQGQWGPHRAKMICLKCGGAWVKWLAE
jgi:hypothetical protein